MLFQSYNIYSHQYICKGNGYSTHLIQKGSREIENNYNRCYLQRIAALRELGLEIGILFVNHLIRQKMTLTIGIVICFELSGVQKIVLE